MGRRVCGVRWALVVDDLAVAGLDGLSREELLAVVRSQAVVVEDQAALLQAQAAQIEVLSVQVAELSRQLGRNSQNSSMPPSSDVFVKPKPVRDRRKPTARKPGKQPGVSGSTLEFVADPDVILDHVPDACGGCGGDLADAEEAGTVVRQVRDAPRVGITITEHRIHKLLCGCGVVTAAPAAVGVDGPVSYGPNLRTLAVYLVVFQHVPVERAALLITDLTGATVSTGWVCGQVARTAEALVEVETLIKTLLTAAVVLGADETTISIAGKKQWLHVARTDLLTAFHLHTSRGRVAVNEFGILPTYPGTLVRDALSVYDTYPATHALCGAHLIRELTAVAEAHPDLIWPVQARTALADLAEAARQARAKGHTVIPAELADEHLRLFRHAILVGLATHRRTGTGKQTKARNLLERMRDREPEILRFTTDLAVPFTNNGAERDLRPVKTQMKISGSHRTTAGAQAWLRIRGYISTVRKHRDDVYTALHDAITGNPWTPPTTSTT
ncbi:MAG: IS66 family transposase [Nocardioides sp.]